jgi:hypothetical protein
MNRILSVTAVIALVALSVPVTRGQTPGTTTPNANIAMPQEVAAPALVQSNPRPNDADARACLDLPSNAEIIRCAEKFLPRKRGA